MEDIKTLINKYLEGDTSDAEESRLRNFFTQEGASIPEEWRVYKALFAFEVHERTKLSASEDDDDTGKMHYADETNNVLAIDSKPQVTANRHKITLRDWTWILSAAASVAILIAIAMKSSGMPENYVVVNGKVITTNKKSVASEAEDALRLVSAESDDDFSALDMMRQ